MSLLPQIYQKEIRREKIFRLCFLFFSFASEVLLIGIIFMLPSYFSLIFSANEVLRRWDAEKQAFERQDITSFEDTITQINRRAMLYTNNENKRYHLARLLVRVAEADDKYIHLNSINLQSENDGSFKFAIRGSATTRDAFISYIQRLKDTPEFLSVYSPISNLLRESNISFAIDILIKQESYYYAANQ